MDADAQDSEPGRSWRETLAQVATPRALRMLALGFASGLPLLLVFSTLSVWLVQAGVERGAVTFFSWAGLAYAFKFLWSPLVDRVEVPVLSRRLGHRRGWLLFAQALVIAALLYTATTDPAEALTWTAIGIVGVAFASATQDIVIDAYRIESAPKEMQALLSALYIAGYRVAMVTSGAGSLWLSDWLGGESYDPAVWATVYRSMAALMLLGILVTLTAPEPAVERDVSHDARTQARLLIGFVLGVLSLVGAFIAIGGGPDDLEPLGRFGFNAARMLGGLAVAGAVLYAATRSGLVPGREARMAYVAPVTDFVARHGRVAIAILALIGLYRIADIVMGVIANVFYLEKGFTASQIATYTKFYGLIATIVGGFLGGFAALRMGVLRALLLGAVLAAASNLLFAYLAVVEADVRLLMAVITVDNLSAGLASAAFVAYLSGLTRIEFTATQFALFTSLMTLLPKLVAGYSGLLVDALGYPTFFVGTAVLGIPVVALIVWIARAEPDARPEEP